MKKIMLTFLCAGLVLCAGFCVSAKHIRDDSVTVFAQISDEASTDAQLPEESEQQKTLAQVENLTVVKSLQGGFSLSWSAVPDAYAYRVFIKDEKEEKYKYSMTVKGTQATITDIENEGGLRVKVRAFCYDGADVVEGDFSESVGAVTAPAGVKKIYTRNISNDSITLYWDKAKGATGYRVYIYDTKKEKFRIYKRTSRTTITVNSLQKDTGYTFRIMSYKKIDNSVAFGDFSEDYAEYTYNSGALPHTKAQAAQYYNNHIAKLKAQENMTIKYNKSIDTEFISCTTQNLAVSVKNTLNLFEGTLSQKYNIRNGKGDLKSANRLIEPYGKKAALEKEDISSFSVHEKDGSIIFEVIIKSENKIYKKGEKNQKSYFDGVLTLPEYKTLKTAPLSIDGADSYYSYGTLTLKITDRRVSVFKVNAAVLSNIAFSVSDVKSSAVIGYELNERYEIKYDV